MPRGLSPRNHVTSYLEMEDALGELREAMDDGDLEAAAHGLEKVERAHDEHAPDLSVAEAAERLGVTGPTVRSWAGKELLEMLDTSPKTVSVRSVVALEDKLSRLRQVAVDKRKWAALIQQARDREEMELPGAREGLKEAIAARRRQARQRAGRSRRRQRVAA